MRSMRTMAVAAALCAVAPATQAWEREHARLFALLPDGMGGPEGLEIDPRGQVYVASFGFTAQGALGGEGQLAVFDRHGRLVRQVTIHPSSPHLLGLRWQESSGKLLVADFGGAKVLSVDPVTGAASDFMTLPSTLPHADATSSLNDITFDSAGNVYVSDSFQGVVWRVGPAGGQASAWVDDPLLRTTGVPPFGANGLRFDHDESALFVANTGSDTVVRIPITGGPPGSTGAPGAGVVFANGINGADGLEIDHEGNLWVVANQADEVVVVDPSGRAIAKLGDFGGVRHGRPTGLLFPASLRFRGRELLVTNLALDLRKVDPSLVTVDAPWCALVTRYTVSALPAVIPPLGDGWAGFLDDLAAAR